MVYTLSGARFTTIPWSSHSDRRNDPTFSFLLTPRLHFSRKNFAGKSSYGSQISPLTVVASEKETTATKEKCYNNTLSPHKSEVLSTLGKLTSLNKPWKRSLTLLNCEARNGRSFNYVKLLLMCGFFTLQSSHQAVAGTDVQSFSFLGDLGDISTGFASAFLLIFFSELGDKTFFIANFALMHATIVVNIKSNIYWGVFVISETSEKVNNSAKLMALLAARNSAAVTFIGTFGALAVMTIISVVLGRTFHYVDDILPFRFMNADLPIDDIAAVCLLVYFGVSSLIDASSGDGQKAEEEQKEGKFCNFSPPGEVRVIMPNLRVVDAELAVSELSGSGAGILAVANTVFSTFALVFVAEWGDKSFFSTIALAAASSPLGVIAGALAGHGVATLLAVLGGSFLGTYLSEKTIAYIGGTLFLVFAAVTLVEIIN